MVIQMIDINKIIYELLNNIPHLVYHITTDPQNIKKYGLCSPKELYLKNKQLFHNNTFRIYKERVIKYFKKEEITDENVLEYLDISRKPLDSSCIWFSFIPKKLMPKIKYGVEFSIDIKILQNYSLGNPILLSRKHDFKIVSWIDLDKNFQEYYNMAKEGAEKYKDDVGLKYKGILQLAVPCNCIPYSKLILVE